MLPLEPVVLANHPFLLLYSSPTGSLSLDVAFLSFSPRSPELCSLSISQVGSSLSKTHIFLFCLLLVADSAKTEPFEENSFLERFMVEVGTLFLLSATSTTSSRCQSSDLHFGYWV